MINRIEEPTATTEIIAATFIAARRDETEAIVASCVAKFTFEKASEICKKVNKGPRPVKIVGTEDINF